MKPIFRLPLTLLLIAGLLLSLVGCTRIEPLEAEEHVFGCLDAFVRRDYAAADSYFHPAARRLPDFKTSAEYAELLILRHRIDLSRGYEVTDQQGEKYTGIRSAEYDFALEGTVGGVRVAVSAILLRDAEGFGIYSLTVAPVLQAVIAK